MKAAFFRIGGKFEIKECPTPEPGAGDVLVKVSYCGICGSDVHLVEAGMLPGGCIIGHELSGTVTAVGDGIDDWKEGDQVAVMPIDPCFQCRSCADGHTQLCKGGFDRSYGLGKLPGGFAEYMLVRPSMLYSVPDGLSLKTAALNEPWSVAVHGAKMLDLKDDSLALVMGSGPIGLLCIYALKRAGVANIFVSEPDGYRREKAAGAGASEVIDPGSTRPATVLHKKAGRSPDIVIDCAGTKDSTRDAIAMAGPRGTVLVLGVHMGNIQVFPLQCFAKEVAIRFSFGYQAVEFGESLELLGKGVIDPDVVISDAMPLPDIEAAFKMLKESGHSKILIDCQNA